MGSQKILIQSEFHYSAFSSNCYRGTRLKHLARIPLPDKARHISVDRPYIYVSTRERSITVYRIVPESESTYKIEKCFGDVQSRSTISHAVVEQPHNRLILLADLSSELTILGQPEPIPDSYFGVRPLFSSNMRYMLSRLEFSRFRPPWRYATGRDSFEYPEVLATSPSGAIIYLRILPETPAKLLTFLTRLVEYTKQAKEEAQGACLESPICVDPDKPKHALSEHMALISGKSQINLISDADRLMPIFPSDDAESKLLDMLTQPFWEVSRQEMHQHNQERNDQAERITLFVKLVEATKSDVERRESESQDCTGSQGGTDQMDLEEAIDWCVTWVADMVSTAF
jgi:hypothetical protein